MASVTDNTALPDIADIADIAPINNTDQIASFTDQLIGNMKDGLLKSWLSDNLPGIMGFFWSVVFALVVYYVGRKIIKLILKLAKKGMDKRNVDPGVQSFTQSLLKAGLHVVLFIIILGLFGIGTSSVAAAVATLGLTAGLSLQGSLSNFAGGVMILLFKPFVVGDYIIEHTHGKEGTVTAITIFYTKLMTVEQQVVVIPNGTLSNTSVTNCTTNPTRRVALIFPISYSDDIKAAKEVLKKVAEEEPLRIRDSEITVFVNELSGRSVDLGLRFFVMAPDYWPARWDTIERAKYALEEAGFTIPFSQVDVHFDAPGAEKMNVNG